MFLFRAKCVLAVLPEMCCDTYCNPQPLVRKDLPDIVRALSSLEGVRNVGITTNGINLRRKMPALHAAGLTHINVSAPVSQPSDRRCIAVPHTSPCCRHWE